MYSKRKNKIINFALFVALVIIPWAFVTFYVMTLAHPRFVSTSEVVVKQVSETTVSAGGLGALLGVNNTSVEDARYLTEYILSNDMIEKLDEQFKFRQAYYIDGSDPIYEIEPDATQEELLKYFKDRIHVNLDEQTFILSVSTEGFSTDYALELNKAILAESDTFVNRISQQIAKDQLVFAERQLDDAQKRLNDTKEALLSYQNENEIFDPQANALMVNQLIGSLQAQLSSLRTEERQLLSYLNPDAPQVVSLRSQIDAVSQQINEEQKRLTSPNTTRLNRQTVQFETLQADVEFATELYKLSLTSLEQSRLEALQKMKNLIVISAPYEAEEALYPRRQYIIWVSFILLLIMYGFVRLVIAVINDHKT